MAKIYYSLLILIPLLVTSSCSPESTPTDSTPIYQLTLTAEPAEAGTVSPSSGEYDEGEEVEITASPNEGWVFDSWQGDHSGSANPDAVTMNSDKEITALFVLREYPITVEIEGEGTVEEKVVQDGSADNEDTPILELTATPADGWRFIHWEGDIEGNTNPVNIILDSEKSVTAVFERREYPLTIEIEGNGTVTEEILHSMAAEYPFETVVQLTATAAGGWIFSHWEGDVTGSENPEQIEITDEKGVTAIFEKDFFELNIDIDGEGSVETVVESGSESEGLYEYESMIELTAVPEDGWQFDQWSGDISGSENPVTIEIGVDNDVVASFIQQGFTLSITAEGEGSVSKSLLSGSETEDGYEFESEVELTAIPAEGWQFVHWEGDVTGDENPVTITIDGAKSIKAIFEEAPVTDEITMVDLGQYNIIGYPQDINDHGHIISISSPLDFYWNSDTGELIEMPIEGRAMNNHGQVVGEHFLWDQNQGKIEIKHPYENLIIDEEYIQANDINNNGQVVGGAFIREIVEDEEGEPDAYIEQDEAFIWHPETGYRSVWIGLYANGINDSELIVGADRYVFSDNLHDYETIESNSEFRGPNANAVNNHGQVVGSIQVLQNGNNNLLSLHSNKSHSEDTNVVQDLLKITNTGGMYDYGHVVEMLRNSTFDSEVLQFREVERSFSMTSTYNEKLVVRWDPEEQHQIIETALNSTYQSEAFIWDEQSGITSIGTLGGEWTTAWDINDHGQVVGYSNIGNDEHRAFYWDEEQGMIELPTYGGNSLARAINNNGQIVGYSYDTNGQLHPVMWEVSFEPQTLSVTGGY